MTSTTVVAPAIPCCLISQRPSGWTYSWPAGLLENAPPTPAHDPSACPPQHAQISTFTQPLSLFPLHCLQSSTHSLVVPFSLYSMAIRTCRNRRTEQQNTLPTGCSHLRIARCAPSPSRYISSQRLSTNFVMVFPDVAGRRISSFSAFIDSRGWCASFRLDLLPRTRVFGTTVQVLITSISGAGSPEWSPLFKPVNHFGTYDVVFMLKFSDLINVSGIP